MDDGGKCLIANQSLGAALVNIEEERVLKSQVADTRLINGRQVVLQPELKLNLTSGWIT